MNLIAVTHAQGTALTVAIIILIVLLGGFVITNDFDWFD